METIELTRKELYDIVWSTTLSKLTHQYAYTNDGIKKLCKQFEIPMPDGSYWSKLKFNKKYKKEKLNPIFGGVDKIILTIREEGNPINVDQTPLTIRTKEIENDPNAPLIVPDEIKKPDILTIQTKQYWQGKISFTSYRNDNRIIYPIRVEKNNRERGLRFMDAFTKLIRYRGHTISKQYDDTGVLIDGIFIEIDLREASKRVPAKHPYSGTELVPIGEFIFKIGKYYPEREWRDGKVKIEMLLAKIVAKIEIEAQIEKEWKEKSRIANLKREEEEKRQAEIKKRRDEEVVKFNKLVALSEQYSKTLLIRQYIEAIKQNAIDTNSLTSEKQEWINWAIDKADWLDPLINKPDGILDAK
ncbi:hypothetical protein SAMN05443549_11519 [Flavobacterium fluvii]|uniref:Uncharacterized protein n=1 Tax=Flavobacterium fluvii TaxID=468056 RepID=A0A1M5Q077_9FLAO|nr:hypothetical protein [Flavobacterium fluvii]SHH07340.1 hypothetical protein SAMN05443549_11519 [Flavobacterium fluvii]